MAYEKGAAVLRMVRAYLARDEAAPPLMRRLQSQVLVCHVCAYIVLTLSLTSEYNMRHCSLSPILFPLGPTSLLQGVGCGNRLDAIELLATGAELRAQSFVKANS